MVDQPKDLLVFPCDFPIKIMGESQYHLQDAVKQCLIGLNVSFDDDIKIRPSRTGRYLGLTVVLLQVPSKAVLDEVYRTLSSHPWVKVAL
jgi:putative lipoic acid-binding regulatory protein